MFRDYRFHPEYSTKVKGGFRSLTYSNKLDAEATLCENELLSGQCLDEECTDQHFAKIGVNGAERPSPCVTRYPCDTSPISSLHIAWRVGGDAAANTVY